MSRTLIRRLILSVLLVATIAACDDDSGTGSGSGNGPDCPDGYSQSACDDSNDFVEDFGK